MKYKFIDVDGSEATKGTPMRSISGKLRTFSHVDEQGRIAFQEPEDAVPHFFSPAAFPDWRLVLQVNDDIQVAIKEATCSLVMTLRDIDHHLGEWAEGQAEAGKDRAEIVAMLQAAVADSGRT